MIRTIAIRVLRRDRPGALLRIGLAAGAGALGAACALLAYAYLAPLTPLEQQAPPAGTVIVDRHGAPLLRDASEGVRIPVSLDEIAPIAVGATIAAEDQRFREHSGVDLLAVASALTEAAVGRAQPRGASTITQQLARRLYLSGTDSPALLRKAREALIALQLEARHSKRELIEAYLNHVYYGRGAYGIEAAARRYFGVGARQLDLAQASFLAGLPQLPSVYGDESAAARTRQRYVLDRLAADGVITPQQASSAARTPLAFADAGEPALAPHFTTMVNEELARLRPDLAGQPGLIIETTLDSALQREAARSLRAHLSRIRNRNAGNGAVVALDTASGALLALVGSADFSEERTGQVNMALAPRQPGSALKPFLYAAAFERGYTAATVLLDVPSSFLTPVGSYQPLNYDLRFRGPTPLRVALASSLNVPAVRTLDRIGVDALLEIADRAGLEGLAEFEDHGLSLTLGSGEVPLLDLTAAYGALAAGGLRAEPYAIERVRDAATGELLYERARGTRERVVTAEHAFLLADILSDPLARAPAFGFGSVLETPFPAAVKTGTTSQFRDSWAVGFTPERAVGVWVGNADGAPMVDLPGLAGAAPIWRDVIEAATADRPVLGFTPPETMVAVTVCSPTGLLPGPHCPSHVREWFIAGTEPVETETYYLPRADGALAIDPPAEARPWAARAGVRLAKHEDGASEAGLTIVQPAQGAVLYIAPELARQEALLRAAAPASAEQIEFRIDGVPVGSASGPDARVVWTLAVGVHRLEVVATLSGGGTATASAQFEVQDR